jgi:hypothetical protein
MSYLEELRQRFPMDVRPENWQGTAEVLGSCVAEAAKEVDRLRESERFLFEQGFAQAMAADKWKGLAEQRARDVASMTASAVKEAEQMDKLAADLEACRQQARAHLAAGEKARDQFEQATHMLEHMLEQIATAPGGLVKLIKTNNEDLQSLAKIFLADLEQRRS